MDGDDSDSTISDQGNEDPTPVEPVHTVEDLLRAPEPVPIPPSPFTSDQLQVIQNTVETSISQALQEGQIRPGTSVSQVQPCSQLRPSGTASPMGLHCPLQKNLEDKILQGEYIDFTLLLSDCLLPVPQGSAPGEGFGPRLPCFPCHDGVQAKASD